MTQLQPTAATSELGPPQANASWMREHRNPLIVSATALVASLTLAAFHPNGSEAAPPSVSTQAQTESYCIAGDQYIECDSSGAEQNTLHDFVLFACTDNLKPGKDRRRGMSALVLSKKQSDYFDLLSPSSVPLAIDQLPFQQKMLIGPCDKPMNTFTRRATIPNNKREKPRIIYHNTKFTDYRVFCNLTRKYAVVLSRGGSGYTPKLPDVFTAIDNPVPNSIKTERKILGFWPSKYDRFHNLKSPNGSTVPVSFTDGSTMTLGLAYEWTAGTLNRDDPSACGKVEAALPHYPN